MLLLVCDAVFDVHNRVSLAHWGGALHGFVEGAVVNHASFLLPLWRPHGMDGFSCIALEAPPFESPPEQFFRFGIVLFRHAAQAWAPLLRALMLQTQSGLHGRAWRLEHVALIQPGATVLNVVTAGRLTDPLPEPEDTGSWLRRSPQPTIDPDAFLHHMYLRSPLLLGGRGRIRREQAPVWPSLKSVLDSIARRAWALEPELATAIGTPEGWQAPPELAEVLPLTPAHEPSRAVQWLYDPRRHIVKPGLVGQLIYPARLDAACQRLLYWGQWLGVGQQTTMGCGRYVWRAQSLDLQDKSPCSACPQSVDSYEFESN